VKIIGGHDYYDSAIAYGIDKETIYVRKCEIIEGRVRGTLYTTLHSKKSEFRLEKHAIGFCGKIYPVLKIERNPYKQERKDPYFDWYFYNAEDVRNFFKEYGIKPEPLSKWGPNIVTHSFINKRLDKFYDVNNWRHLESEFRKHHCPVFHHAGSYKDSGNGPFTLNPILKRFHFAKVFSPTEAFQEIFMYLTGVLGKSPKTLIEISNDDMRHKKGFDNKSFKTDSPGKKRKRRQK